MPEEISKRILIGELIIIVLPSSLILLLATISQISLTFAPFPWTRWDWYNFANTLFALFACTALISGLVVSQKFLHQGKAGLTSVETKWWFFSFLGGVLTIASALVSTLPPPPEYSAEENFRQAFDSFRLGIPLFIPFTHLLLERYLRKS